MKIEAEPTEEIFEVETASFVLAGTEKSTMTSFGSTCHGAGRRLSRTAAKSRLEEKLYVISF